MAKDILKEAIADAKAVREVALANAKAALEEAFTPRLQSMLSAKLSEDLNEEYDEDEKDMKEYYDEDEKDKMDEMMYDEDEADEDMKEMAYDEDADEDMKETYMEDEKDSMDEEIDLEEILAELELEEGKDEDKDMKKEGKDEADEDMKKEELDEMGRPVYKAEEANYVGYTADRVHENETFDLDALLEEINNLDEKEDKDDVKEGMTKKEEEYWKKVSSGGGGFGHFEEMNVKTDEEWWKQYNSFFEGVDENIDEMRMPMSPKEFEDFAKGKGHSDEFIRLMTGPMGPYGNMMEDQTNEVVGIAAGLAGVIAAAGGLTALEMAADDPEFKNKYPKVPRALEKLQHIGKAAADAKRMEEETKNE